MTREEILQAFYDINFVYNDCSKYDTLKRMLEELTEDVVEVIRCKDCVNWQDDWYTSHDGYHYCAMVDIITDGDFYCKDGERKILPKM